MRSCIQCGEEIPYGEFCSNYCYNIFVITFLHRHLGICVGMQLMANIGQENKKTNGFGWIPGEVVEISSGDSTLKIPHMGWNDLIIHKPDHPAMSGLTDGAHAYFVHSYQFVTHNPKDILATVNYGVPLTAAVAKNNLIGTQFHPEKSQQTGITFIKNFLSWQP